MHAEDKNGCTALHYAAETGSVDVARVWSANVASVNTTRSNGGTPLDGALYPAKKHQVKAEEEHAKRCMETSAWFPGGLADKFDRLPD